LAAQAGTSKITRAFFDTNVLVYSDDPASPEKQKRAIDLIQVHRLDRSGVISIQVLQEYFVASTKKLGLDPGFAKSKVEVWARFQVVEPGVGDVLAAIDLHRLSGVSFWDALIVRCAKEAGCSVLLSEDMQHGQAIDGVRITNPFI
jgi:predicted nucleic acid-binding protein